NSEEQPARGELRQRVDRDAPGPSLVSANRNQSFMYDKTALMDLVRKVALQIGQFKLASGKMSSYYLDCRKVTLDSAGANLIADGMLELLGADLPDAVGGMAIGADPITAAIITVAGREGKKLHGLNVR